MSLAQNELELAVKFMQCVSKVGDPKHDPPINDWAGRFRVVMEDWQTRNWEAIPDSIPQLQKIAGEMENWCCDHTFSRPETDLSRQALDLNLKTLRDASTRIYYFCMIIEADYNQWAKQGENNAG